MPRTVMDERAGEDEVRAHVREPGPAGVGPVVDDHGADEDGQSVVGGGPQASDETADDATPRSA
ncbi:hypothetical protein [Pseudokineococcus sp. 1T1Z-3]|uniref:hypothetical protein n=1 Tax=Pseudokineococcus sp. 1T1Z-3 TaxID=3132745 RepID=UPI0030B6D7B1